jgi:hypothetical protein
MAAASKTMPGSGPQIMNQIWGHNPSHPHASPDDLQELGEFKLDADGNPVLPSPTSAGAPALGVANSADAELAHDNVCSLHQDAPAARVRLGSNSVENAAYNDFLLDGPESLEHGAAAELGEMSMSLADSASLNLSIADLPASHATRKNKNMEISFESLCVNEKSIQGEASWDVTNMGSLEIDAIPAPDIIDSKHQLSPRVPPSSDPDSSSTTTTSPSASAASAASNNNLSVNDSRMQLSVPDTPLGFSDASLENVFKNSADSSKARPENVLKNSADSSKEGSKVEAKAPAQHAQRQRQRKLKTKHAIQQGGNLTPLERLLKRAETDSQYEPTPVRARVPFGADKVVVSL